MSRNFARQTANEGMLYERAVGTMFDWGLLANLPASGVVGYGPGCIWIARDQTTAWTQIYVNNGNNGFGNNSGANFQLLSSMPPSGISSITIPANTGPNDFYITDGTTKYFSVDTRNTVSGVDGVSIIGNSPTIASAAGVTYSAAYINAETITLTGTTTVTAMDGIGLYIDQPTITDASAGTVTTVSNLYVAAPTAAGGSLTITNSYAAHIGGAMRVDGNINLAAQATTITIKAATASDLVVTDGTTSMISVDTRTTTSGGGGVTFTGQPTSYASAASALLASTVSLAAKTVTLTGTTTTTSLLGCQLYLGAVTATDSSACTLTTLSNMHIVANAAAGGSLTITNSYMISTSVAGCFLTNAGTFTSASTRAHKEEIEDAQAEDIYGILDNVRPRSYRLKEQFRDFGRLRLGLIAEELPESLRAPGTTESTGLPDGIAAAFAVVACKQLLKENRELRTRLERVEELLNIID